MHGGAGMVRLVTPPAPRRRSGWSHPEVVMTELAGDGGPRFPQDVGRVQAWVAGPGMGTDDDAARTARGVLATNLPVLVDADGLTLLASHRELLPRAAPTLLTPHAGELGRLLGADPADVEARRLEHARRAAAEFGACVLLKGSTTVVAPPDDVDPVLVNTTGTSWLATAGTGDVLCRAGGRAARAGAAAPQAALARRLPARPGRAAGRRRATAAGRHGAGRRQRRARRWMAGRRRRPRSAPPTWSAHCLAALTP